MSQSTTVDDIVANFDDNERVFERELVIGWLKELDHIPLWSYAGVHEFNYQSVPSQIN